MQSQEEQPNSEPVTAKTVVRQLERRVVVVVGFAVV